MKPGSAESAGAAFVLILFFGCLFVALYFTVTRIK
jgi:hypothetical protein